MTWRWFSTNISSAILMFRTPYLFTSRSISATTRPGARSDSCSPRRRRPIICSPALNGAWMQQNEQ